VESPVTERDAASGGGRPGGRPRGALQRGYRFLVSPKLAIAVLIFVLACCVVGVTALRGERAWALIFSTIWFNAVLVLLAISSAAAFFNRIWRRKLTIASVGMIVFHLSFAALLAGVVYNALFHFRGVLRLTEGEKLPNGKLDSYDVVELGRLFDLRWLQGETTLIRMHRRYTVDGQEKRAAYEIQVGEPGSQTSGIIYVTRDLEHDGVRYLCAKEGYSVLVVMADREGREVYGAHIPLQSLKQPDGAFLYATGQATGPASFPFPFPPEQPKFEMMLTYRPSAVEDRGGEVGFQVVPREGHDPPASEQKGLVTIGGSFDAGEFTLSPREVRYWVGMDVRYDPGLKLILTSLCLGLGGMTITFVGRLRQGAGKKRAA
jgi:hypothetical protein